MQKVYCSVCGTECVPDRISKGYGVNDKGEKLCYECCGKQDRQELINMKIGDKTVLYLTYDKQTGRGQISNWPGTLKISVFCWQGKHNLAKVRYDCDFKLDGKTYHGTRYGMNSEICYIRRTR